MTEKTATADSAAGAGGLTHFDANGDAVMVDVSDKAVTSRTAKAKARVVMAPQTLALIQQGGHKKGDVLAVARLAGIMAAKRTHELIPLCHPLALTKLAVSFDVQPGDAGRPPAVEIEAMAKVSGQTGVEMEALTAASVAALTIYDMCKAVDKGMTIEAVRLTFKDGGKSGAYEAV